MLVLCLDSNTNKTLSSKPCQLLVGNDMQPLHDSIYLKILPAIVKHVLNENEIHLMRLPTYSGGMTFDDSARGYIHVGACQASQEATFRTLANSFLVTVARLEQTIIIISFSYIYITILQTFISQCRF